MKNPVNKIPLKIEEVKKAIAKHGGIQPAAAHFKVSHHVIRRVLAEGGEHSVPSKPTPRAQRKTLGDFQKSFDKSFIVPERIKAGIGKYLHGGFWEHDQNFRELCRVPANLWHRFREQFDEYQIRVDGKVVWAEPETIEKMREMTL
jgi:hypothetical protein